MTKWHHLSRTGPCFEFRSFYFYLLLQLLSACFSLWLHCLPHGQDKLGPLFASLQDNSADVILVMQTIGFQKDLFSPEKEAVWVLTAYITGLLTLSSFFHW